MSTHNSESVSIVNKDSELEFLLQFYNLIQNSQSTGHSVNSLSYKEYAASLLLCTLGCAVENLLAVCNVVVSILHSVTHVKSQSVHNAGMALFIIYNNVSSGKESIQCGNHSLISEVEEESILFALKLSQFLLQLLVQ